MAGQKQRAPYQRTPSDFTNGVPGPEKSARNTNGAARAPDGDAHGGSVGNALAPVMTPSSQSSAGILQLIICVGGIYASFLSWAVLQERITTTNYSSSASKPARWTYPLVLNTLQSALASLTGLLYLYFSTPGNAAVPSPFPSLRALPPLVLVALTSSLASPFGYASLAHIDYLTFILAKACKLLPVMFLNLTIFRRRYPLPKYAVVGLVTAGVAIFTLYQHQPGGGRSKKSSRSTLSESRSPLWGISLLGVNLLFDGLTNATQDHIFATMKPRYTGPQMMAAQNLLSTLLTTAYLLLTPYLPAPLLQTFSIPPATTTELAAALAFLRAHPASLADMLAFCACGAVGQIFIYATLARFSSLLLVTVTVTRKMLSMLLSVLWFGKSLGAGQWVGVGLVFGGVGAEAWMARQEKMKKKAGNGREGKKEL